MKRAPKILAPLGKPISSNTVTFPPVGVFRQVPSPPSFMVQPSITFTAPLAVGTVLTLNDGTVSNGTVTARALLRDGVVINADPGSTYTALEADLGAEFAFSVTASGVGGITTATSAAVGPVLDLESEITSNTITFTFAVAQATGAYVTGDPWGLIPSGGVTIAAVDPASVVRSGTNVGGATYTDETFNGLMVNPGLGNDGWVRASNPQGFTSVNKNSATGVGTSFQAFDATLNKHPAIAGALTITEPSTLWATKMLATPPLNMRDGLTTDAALVTLVNAIPPANAFRPSPSSADKASYFTTADVDLSFLPNVAAPSGMPTFETMMASVSQPFQTAFTNNLFTRQINVQGYGREIANSIGDILLALCTNHLTSEQKATLSNRLIQVGLDVVNRAIAGGNWAIVAGWGGGQHWAKAPAIFAAHALRNASNSAKATELLNRVDWEQFTWAVEDRMAFPVTRSVIETPVVARVNFQRVNYESPMENAPGWSSSGNQAQLGSSAWNNDYRDIVAAGTLRNVLALRMMGIGEYFAPIWVDYIDMIWDWSKIETFGSQAPPAWVGEMLDAHLPTASANYSDTAAPSIVRTVARESFVWFEFNKLISRRWNPAADAFAVLVNGVARTVVDEANVFTGDPETSRHRSPNIYGYSMGVRLLTPVDEGDTVTIAYTQPGSDQPRTLGGTNIASITATTATNLTGALPDAAPSIARVNGQTDLARAERQFSATRAFPAETVDWLQMSLRFRTLSRTQSDTLVCGSNASTNRFWLAWAGVAATTLQCFFSTASTDRFSLANAPTNLPDNTWITMHLWVDYSAATAADMYRVTFHWDGGSWTPATTGAARTVVSPTLASLFNQGLSIGGAKATADREADADFGELLFRYGTGAAPDAPDFTTAPFAWDADWGANGQNVWGQPQLYYGGTLIEWNTALPNRGDFGAFPMLPQNGASDDAEAGGSNAAFVLAAA